MNYPITALDQLRPILIGFRKSRGLTQATLAEKLGVAQQTYAQLEANPTAISVERLIKLLRVLGVELVLADTVRDESPTMAAKTLARLKQLNESHPTQRARPPSPPSNTGIQKVGKTSRQASKPALLATKKRESW